MAYSKFVQIGRVARINYGEFEGKLGVIVDVISYNRVLIDGEHIQRQIIPIRRLTLLKQIIKIGHGSKHQKLRKIIAKQNVQKTYENSRIGKLALDQTKRANLTDFDRFKVLVLRRKLSKVLRKRTDKKAAKK